MVFDVMKIMSIYECSACGMSANASCEKCDEPVFNYVLVLNNGNQVQIPKSPIGHGKIKSPPLCCGQYMACTG